jgi:Thiamine pyrophosphate-requiring enzymes [acetolactate synthase, pyruvate dehydrogenase (cytochrome), glyoxylate carboligase, phosphonopyruvate decarboxylase]
MPETTTAADLLLDILHDEWGVEVIFGLPGDGINGLMEALRKRQDRIRFVQVRHEEAAAFMACGYAKWTGRLGVCLATQGPGGLHLLNGLYDAKLDRQPVLALTGLPYHDLIGTFTQQDVDLNVVFDNVSVYNARVMGPAHVENVTHLACRAAYGQRGVAHIAFPNSFQSMPVKGAERSARNKPGHEAGNVNRPPVAVPGADALRAAADVLNQGKRVFLLAGRGAQNATDVLQETADRLGAPIGKALLGKTVVPDDHPLTTGSVGFLGTDASQAAMDACDTLLMVGTSFPYIEYLPKPGAARCVQIDADPLRIGLRYPTEVGLVGDSRATLEALLPLLHRQEDRAFLEETQANMATWREDLKAQAARREMPMKPQTVAEELGKRLTDDAIFSADSGTASVWWARQIPARGTQKHSVSGLLASMACGLPYAIAAQIAHPGRQCVAFVGDGGMAMLMAEFKTAVQYRLPIKVVVLNNASYGFIRWEQMLNEGNPEFGVGFEGIDFAAFARACGGTGIRVEDPAECGAALDRAFATDGPVIVDAVVDPFEPPTPPKLSPEQARHFAEALEKGQEPRNVIEHSSLGEKAREQRAAVEE